MIIDCKGFQIDKFKIPPFQLNESEIITLNLFSGGHFFKLEEELVSIFTGRTKNKNVRVYHDLLFAEHIKSGSFRDRIWPTTVKQYLRNKAVPIDILLPTFQGEILIPRTRISNLSNNAMKLLSIHSVLSRCNGLVFDLVGNDHLGASIIYDTVEDHTKNQRGYAILLNNFDDMKGRCKKHIDIELI